MACRYTYKGKSYTEDEFKKFVAEKMPLSEVAPFTGTESLPDAPFIGSTQAWSILAMKRMIRYAAENGFDKLAFTTGDQQAERYDLSKQVDNVRAFRREDGTYDLSAKTPDGRGPHDFGNALPETKLAEIVGKDLADKIAKQPAGWQTYEGTDLKVGGEGMAAFYDKMLPNELNKYVKKWGGKVGTTKVVTNEGVNVPAYESMLGSQMPGKVIPREEREVHSLTITPPMKEAALEGQVMFSLRRKPTGPGSSEIDSFRSKIGDQSPTVLEDLSKHRADGGSFSSFLSDKFTGIGDQSAFQVFDDLHGINAAERAVKGDLPAHKRGYISARLARSRDNLLHAMLADGVPTWKNGVATTDHSGGLLKIMKPIKEHIGDFTDWMVANRAKHLLTEGRENLFTQAEVDATIAHIRGLPHFAAIQQATREYVEFKKKILDFAEQSGLIDPVGRKLWDRSDYVPFFRVMEDGDVKHPKSGRGIANKRGPKKLTGGTANIGDPLENIIANFAHLVSGALDNRAMLKVVDNLAGSDYMEPAGTLFQQALVPMSEVKKYLEESGIDTRAMPQDSLTGVQKMWSMQRPGADEMAVRVMRDGKPEYHTVKDEMLFRSLTQIRQTDVPYLAVPRFFKNMISALITKEPGFAFRDFTRDALSSWTIGEAGMLPATKALAAAAKGWNDPKFIELMASGGGFYSGNTRGSDAKQTKAAVDRALRAKGFRTVLDTPKMAWDLVEQITSFLGNVNRVAIYDTVLARALKEGKSLEEATTEAVFAARDIMDFSMKGAFIGLRILTETVPFLNARLQGLYRNGRGAVDKPGSFAVKGLMISLASFLLWMAFKDDERYEELEEWDRDMNWHFWIGDRHYTMPKPFEVGLMFGTLLGERLPAVFTDEKEGGDRFLKSLAHGIWTTLSFDPTLQAIKPAIEGFRNWNEFMDRPIVSRSMEELEPTEQYLPNTSDTIKALTDAMPEFFPDTLRSPMKMEHMVRGYFGTLGMYAIGIADMVVRRADGHPVRPDFVARDVPVIKGFYRGTGPSRHTRQEREFYELMKEIRTVHKTVLGMENRGEEERLDDYLASKGKQDDLHRDVESWNDDIADINRDIREIYYDRKMSGGEKRRQLDKLQVEKNKLLKEALQDLESGLE